MRLSDIITPDTQVARSVNIERDFGHTATLKQYILTANGLALVRRLAGALNGSAVSAWSLTGPYGMGKSAFGNFLLALCGPGANPETQTALRILAEQDAALHQEWLANVKQQSLAHRGFFRIPVTAAFEPLNLSLARGLLRALPHTQLLASADITGLSARLQQWINQSPADARELLEIFTAIQRCADAPLIIVVDEFGKNLEYMARHARLGDIYILQALAEAPHIFLWVCLHQAFEAYAAGFTAQQVQEWGKIQGRFEDVSFIEMKPQMMAFIRRVLTRRNRQPAIEKHIRQWAEAFHRTIEQYQSAVFNPISAVAIAECYPLHPLTVLALPELCTRFAQNDRTLFAFLCSGEPGALPAFLAAADCEPDLPHLTTYGPELLYRYFLESQPGMSLYRPEARRWIEVNSMVENARGLPALEFRLVQIIGLLNLAGGLISGPQTLRASRDLIALAMFSPLASDSVSREAVFAALEALTSRGMLIWRAYSNEYRLWEGSDVDIPAAIQTQIERLAPQPLDQMLETVMPLAPLTASRHAYQKGTLRHFERRWWHAGNALDISDISLSEDVDGLILYGFGRQALSGGFPHATRDGRPIVVAYTRCEEQIRDIVLHAAAAAAVLKESPALERDGVARREAAFRAGVARDKLQHWLTELFIPGHQDVSWHANNQFCSLNSPRALSALLSDLCDRYYAASPIIRNELINRHKLSTVAARARRELMTAMLNAEGEAAFGFRGTGPEVAMYRTLFQATELHQRDNDGLWRLVEPNTKTAPSFTSVWQNFERVVRNRADEAIAVTDLMDELALPPFGLKKGPVPVLLCHYLAVKSDELALYRDDVFIPSLTAEEMEMMTRRPHLFTLRRFAPTGIRRKVFQVYRRLLNAEAVHESNKVRNLSMLSVVGPLVQFASSLSAYARQTRTVGVHAVSVRNALLRSKEPILLLFDELPQAVDMPPFQQDTPADTHQEREFEARLRNALKSLMDADSMLIQRLQQHIMEAFGTHRAFNLFREELAQQASVLLGPCRDTELKCALSAMSKSGSDTEWVSGIAAAAVTRPLQAWRDSDINEFPTVMRDIAGRFQSFEAIVKSQTGFSESVDTSVRLINFTRPDGRQAKKLIKTERKTTTRAKALLTEIKSKCTQEELEALLLLLGDDVLQ